MVGANLLEAANAVMQDFDVTGGMSKPSGGGQVSRELADLDAPKTGRRDGRIGRGWSVHSRLIACRASVLERVDALVEGQRPALTGGADRFGTVAARLALAAWLACQRDLSASPLLDALAPPFWSHANARPLSRVPAVGLVPPSLGMHPAMRGVLGV